jgi:hypothetical protein
MADARMRLTRTEGGGLQDDWMYVGRKRLPGNVNAIQLFAGRRISFVLRLFKWGGIIHGKRRCILV